MKGSTLFVGGIDIGSLYTKAVILNHESEILAFSVIPSGSDYEDAANKAMEEAQGKAGIILTDIEYIVSTGYGRRIAPFANSAITEITCHAVGAHHLFPEARDRPD